MPFYWPSSPVTALHVRLPTHDWIRRAAKVGRAGKPTTHEERFMVLRRRSFLRQEILILMALVFGSILAPPRPPQRLVYNTWLIVFAFGSALRIGETKGAATGVNGLNEAQEIEEIKEKLQTLLVQSHTEDFQNLSF